MGLARARVLGYTRRVRIDIFSDVICPWCFIGKRRLERALAARPDLRVEVVWRAFQLNPDMPPAGIERQSYIIAKFGSAERAEHLYANIAETGAEEGLAFEFDRIRRTPNTVNAHRLILFAGRNGRQDQVVELLFRRYFQEGVDIGEVESLVAAAADAGLDADETRAYLASDRDVEAVRTEDLEARRLGVTGVPCFIAEGRYAISGAQTPEVFLRVFETAERAAAAE